MPYEKAEKTEQDLEDEKLSSASSEGYVKALDDLLLKSANNPPISMLVLRWVNELKSAYLGGTDGKQS